MILVFHGNYLDVREIQVFGNRLRADLETTELVVPDSPNQALIATIDGVFRNIREDADPSDFSIEVYLST